MVRSRRTDLGSAAALTAERRLALWWWLIPIAAVFAALTWASMELLDPLLGGLGLAVPAGTQTSELMDPQFVGQWWIVGLAVISSVFDTLSARNCCSAGSCFRMAGVFGRGDWVANAVLFALYHVHRFWMLPTVLLTSLPFSWAARHYRTIWFAVVLHGIEGVVLLALVIAVVSGAIEL